MYSVCVGNYKWMPGEEEFSVYFFFVLLFKEALEDKSPLLASNSD